MGLEQFKQFIPGYSQVNSAVYDSAGIQHGLRGDVDLRARVNYNPKSFIGGLRSSWASRSEPPQEPKRRQLAAGLGVAASGAANLYGLVSTTDKIRSPEDMLRFVKDNPSLVGGVGLNSYGAYKAMELDPVALPALVAGTGAMLHGTKALPTKFRAAAVVGSALPGFIAATAKAHGEVQDYHRVNEIIANHSMPVNDRLKELAIIHNAKGLERSFPITRYMQDDIKGWIKDKVEGSQFEDPKTFELDAKTKSMYVQQMRDSLLANYAAQFEEANGRSPSPKEFNKLELEVERKLFP